MKKSILIAILGVAACAATSYGQGYVVMNSYSANNGLGAISTYNGVALNSTWTAELYYALGTVTDSPGLGLPSSSFTALPSSLVHFGGPVADGYFQLSTPVVVPGYTSGAISFEILVDGVAYHGGSFTESTLQNNANFPANLFGDNGPGMPNIVVPVPEPTSLALAGLGGLASLVALRRKQS